MYVKETEWYRKQQRQGACVRKMQRIGMLLLLLLFVCFGALRVFAKDSDKTIEMNMVQALMQPIPMEQAEGLAEYNMGDEENIENDMAKEGALSETKIVEATKDDGVYLIAIDAGHGGMDEGCSFENVEEKQINLTIALKLREKLESVGFQVFMTRSEDMDLSLEERVNLANSEGADAFISIHQNSCDDKSVEGIETWYFASEEKDNERLAKLVQQYTVLYSKAKDRGILETDKLYVIRESKMPSCLVETGFLSNDKEREMLQEEAYYERVAQGIADAVELYFYPKTMYLTFDDGPVTENTNAVLDILKERGIKATFFVVGKNVERNPETAKRIVEEGHTIGIHCYQHDYSELYADVESYVEDFEKAKSIVHEVTGVETKLFRFPGGSINSHNKGVYEDIITEMTEKGYTYFDWNASLEDAVKNPSVEKLLKNAKESTLGRKVVVMLAHDTVDETVDCLEELIEQFPEYEMKALEEETMPVRF